MLPTIHHLAKPSLNPERVRGFRNNRHHDHIAGQPYRKTVPPLSGTVDLDKCDDHGQCVFSAPPVFSLDHDGKLSFRRQAAGSYVSGDLDESLRADVEEAADVCPLQAITVED